MLTQVKLAIKCLKTLITFQFRNHSFKHCKFEVFTPSTRKKNNKKYVNLEIMVNFRSLIHGRTPNLPSWCEASRHVTPRHARTHCVVTNWRRHESASFHPRAACGHLLHRPAAAAIVGCFSQLANICHWRCTPLLSVSIQPVVGSVVRVVGSSPSTVHACAENCIRHAKSLLRRPRECGKAAAR